MIKLLVAHDAPMSESNTCQYVCSNVNIFKYFYFKKRLYMIGININHPYYEILNRYFLIAKLDTVNYRMTQTNMIMDSRTKLFDYVSPWYHHNYSLFKLKQLKCRLNKKRTNLKVAMLWNIYVR